ncbi:amidophosphoribosyltransferase [Nanoarchaeota archaeon]
MGAGDDGAKHECGVAAVFIRKGAKDSLMRNRAPFILYKLLLNMQGRGQLSAGISTFKEDRLRVIDTYKDLGTVNEAFKTSNLSESAGIFKRMLGSKGIGHVRYATCGKDDRSYAQPFERHHARTWKWFTVCFNGNLANYKQLKERYKKEGYHLIKDTDTEVINMTLIKLLGKKKKPDLIKVFQQLAKLFDGAYSIAFMNGDGDVVISKDPLGIRPLAYGYTDDAIIAASETNALLSAGAKNIKELQPGELMLIEDGKVRVEKYADSPRKAHCMFEWVYFADVCSTIEGRSVYGVRTELGKALARLETEPINEKDYVIMAVPDTSKPMANAMAYELKVPIHEGLIRNRYVGRTFIESDEKRESKIQDKFTVLEEVVKGKKVILIDDSLVRGTTAKKIVRYIKEVGKAKEVHLRLACPPIIAPCFYGIDMSTVDELYANKFLNNEKNKEVTKEITRKMADELGADSLIYMTIPDLVKAIGKPKNDLCMACLNSQYPTVWGRKLCRLAKQNTGKTKSSCRTYE